MHNHMHHYAKIKCSARSLAGSLSMAFRSTSRPPSDRFFSLSFFSWVHNHQHMWRSEHAAAAAGRPGGQAGGDGVSMAEGAFFDWRRNSRTNLLVKMHSGRHRKLGHRRRQTSDTSCILGMEDMTRNSSGSLGLCWTIAAAAEAEAQMRWSTERASEPMYRTNGAPPLSLAAVRRSAT